MQTQKEVGLSKPPPENTLENGEQTSEGEPSQEFPPSARTAKLLCDASTVMAIQLTEAELRAINELKVSNEITHHCC